MFSSGQGLGPVGAILLAAAAAAFTYVLTTRGAAAAAAAAPPPFGAAGAPAAAPVGRRVRLRQRPPSAAGTPQRALVDGAASDGVGGDARLPQPERRRQRVERPIAHGEGEAMDVGAGTGLLRREMDVVELGGDESSGGESSGGENESELAASSGADSESEGRRGALRAAPAVARSLAPRPRMRAGAAAAAAAAPARAAPAQPAADVPPPAWASSLAQATAAAKAKRAAIAAATRDRAAGGAAARAAVVIGADVKAETDEGVRAAIRAPGSHYQRRRCPAAECGAMIVDGHAQIVHLTAHDAAAVATAATAAAASVPRRRVGSERTAPLPAAALAAPEPFVRRERFDSLEEAKAAQKSTAMTLGALYVRRGGGRTVRTYHCAHSAPTAEAGASVARLLRAAAAVAAFATSSAPLSSGVAAETAAAQGLGLGLTRHTSFNCAGVQTIVRLASGAWELSTYDAHDHASGPEFALPLRRQGIAALVAGYVENNGGNVDVAWAKYVEASTGSASDPMTERAFRLQASRNLSLDIGRSERLEPEASCIARLFLEHPEFCDNHILGMKFYGGAPVSLTCEETGAEVELGRGTFMIVVVSVRAHTRPRTRANSDTHSPHPSPPRPRTTACASWAKRCRSQQTTRLSTSTCSPACRCSASLASTARQGCP